MLDDSTDASRAYAPNRSHKTIRTIVRIDVEGEVYRRRGTQVNASQAAEVLGVIADARVTLQAWAGEPLKDAEYEIDRVTRDERDITILRHEFDELTYRIDGLLPGVSLPVPGRQINEIS